VPHPIHGQALNGTRHTEAVVTMEVREAQAGNATGRNVGQQKLTLRAFPRIEQQPLAVAAQQISVVVAYRVGTCLAVPRTTNPRIDPC